MCILSCVTRKVPCSVSHCLGVQRALELYQIGQLHAGVDLHFALAVLADLNKLHETDHPGQSDGITFCTSKVSFQADRRSPKKESDGVRFSGRPYHYLYQSLPPKSALLQRCCPP